MPLSEYQFRAWLEQKKYEAQRSIPNWRRRANYKNEIVFHYEREGYGEPEIVDFYYYDKEDRNCELQKKKIDAIIKRYEKEYQKWGLDYNSKFPGVKITLFRLIPPPPEPEAKKWNSDEHGKEYYHPIEGRPTIEIITKFHTEGEYKALCKDMDKIYDLYIKKYGTEIEGYNSKVKGLKFSVEPAKNNDDTTDWDKIELAIKELGLLKEARDLFTQINLKEQAKKNKEEEGRMSEIEGVGYIKYRPIEEQHAFNLLKYEDKPIYYFKHEGDTGVKARLHGWYGYDLWTLDEALIIFRKKIKEWKQDYEINGGGYNSSVPGMEIILEPYPNDIDEFLKKYPYVKYDYSGLEKYSSISYNGKLLIIGEKNMKIYFESKAASLKMAKEF